MIRPLAEGIAVDSSGNAYIAGDTDSSDGSFPVTVGPDLTFNGSSQDAFVAKVSADGSSLVYAGYVGGVSSERARGIAVDSSGNAYIAGDTFSSDFPVTVGPDLTSNGVLDAFVAKVSADGSSLVYAGYVGGLGADRARGIAVDSSGNAYIAGETGSSNFPVTVGPDLTFGGGSRDAFVAKVSADGSSLVYAGYIGGLGTDIAEGIAVDSSGNAYIAGGTDSSDDSFPVTVGPGLTSNEEEDAFVAKVSADGSSLVYAGYVGGSGTDRARGIAVDSSGNAYIAGFTGSSEATFPVTVGPDLTFNVGNDAFVAKVSADGLSLIYAGYVGGSGSDIAGGIAVDSSGNAYIAGGTDSSDFPVTVGPGLTSNGGTDAFVAKVSALDPVSIDFDFFSNLFDEIGPDRPVRGVPYSTTLTGVGGIPPYTWAALAGLPPGLTLGPDGVVSGIPTENGTFFPDLLLTDTLGLMGGLPAGTFFFVEEPLMITDASPLAGGTTGTPYFHQFSTIGPPFGPPIDTSTWNVTGSVDSTPSPPPLLIGGGIPPGLVFNGFGGAISGTPTTGTFTFEVSVERLRLGGLTTKSFELTIVDPLSITSPSPLPTGVTDASYSTMLTATGGAPPLAWSTSGGLPPGLTLGTDGTISGAPTMTGTFMFDATVTDGISQMDMASFEITVVDTLSITSASPLPTGTTGDAYSTALSAAGGSLPLTWSTTAGLPPGLTLGADGTISGAPTMTGTFMFDATVADGISQMDTVSFQITVVDQLLITDTSPLPAGETGTFYLHAFSSSGGTPPVQWSLAAGSLPPGLRLFGGSGTIRDFPTTAGTFNFDVRVSDGSSPIAQSDTMSFELTIFDPLSITSASPLPTGITGDAYSTALTAAGGSPPFTWSTTGGLPPGLTLGTDGTISGASTTPGAFMFDVTATDGISQMATAPFEITIVDIVSISSISPLPSGVTGAAYSTTLSAAGGAEPLTWAATGTLPFGLMLDAGGVISGTRRRSELPRST